MAEWALDDATRALIETARREDLGDGDITSALLEDPRRPARFELVARQPGVFAGRAVAEAVLRAYDPALRLAWSSAGSDGAVIPLPGASIATLTGPLFSLLAAERVMLNFLQRLCGIATLTRRYCEAVAGTDARVFDTRKTTPGWRMLEKYAVRCGGGCNHRSGLYDAVLVKDNHLAGVPSHRLASHVFDMLNRLGALPHAPVFVEVEAQSLEEAESLFKVVGIHVVLLDNFKVEDLARAVRRRDNWGLKGKIELEASGGVNLDTVRSIAQTGVERISVGALTHSAPAMDLALERIEPGESAPRR